MNPELAARELAEKFPFRHVSVRERPNEYRAPLLVTVAAADPPEVLEIVLGMARAGYRGVAVDVLVAAAVEEVPDPPPDAPGAGRHADASNAVTRRRTADRGDRSDAAYHGDRFEAGEW